MIMTYFILQVKHSEPNHLLLLEYANTFFIWPRLSHFIFGSFGKYADRRGRWQEVVLLYSNSMITQNSFRLLCFLYSSVCSVLIKPKSKGNSHRLTFKVASAPIVQLIIAKGVHLLTLNMTDRTQHRQFAKNVYLNVQLSG